MDTTRRLWLGLAALMIAGFGVLLWMGWDIHLQAPPVPERVVSDRGDVIYDPFGGLMTVPYRALLKGRKGRASELSATYFHDGLHYCRKAEAKMAIPSMFDMLGLADDLEAAE